MGCAQTYIDALRKNPLDQKTEHSDCAALESLPNASATLRKQKETLHTPISLLIIFT
jgi:hypothetical protein